jgi:hypothetical protein
MKTSYLLLSSSLLALGALGITGCSGNSSQAGGTVVFTASGEVLALGGYDFPPAPDGVAFVDGWELRFSEVLVTVDSITLSENPDRNPGDQSKTGNLVARLDGPWAIDLHRGGPVAGKGGGDEQAVELGRLSTQNLNGDIPLASDERYAFGFDVTAAKPTAKRVNLSAEAEADYQTMIQKGYSVLYVGTATFKGTDCTPADPVFDTLPKVVAFKLGFASPTSYRNCQNPDNDPATPFADEEHERGIIIKANQAVTAQVTIHTDHPFWESFKHDSPAHFDPIAAQYVGATGTPTAVLEDLADVDTEGFTTKTGSLLPFRSCTADYTPPSMGQLHFDTQGVAINPTGDPTKVLRGYADFMTYAQSTQGHMNSDGLCFVARNYRSPL